MRGFFVAKDDSLRYEGGFVDDLYVDLDILNWMELIGLLRRGSYRNIKALFYNRQYFELFEGVKAVYNDATVLEMVAEMVLEGEIDVYVEHGVEEPEIVIHIIEGPPENGEENASEHVDGENVENGENADGQGGDYFVEVEVVQQRVEEDDSESDSDGESESVLSEYPDSDEYREVESDT
ncbi:hypothetical protein COLO4_12784 [Corchorus olitorius]|uniref:PB1-like domain-containing protein n=1 Tax=Corchorus olitorius TaxID=93759 RepID=A0A1R3JZN0_9ROSI|nr:hypothetical protein COLO4_12784 [Corchorus olitorius]